MIRKKAVETRERVVAAETAVALREERKRTSWVSVAAAAFGAGRATSTSSSYTRCGRLSSFSQVASSPSVQW